MNTTSNSLNDQIFVEIEGDQRLQILDISLCKYGKM